VRLNGVVVVTGTGTEIGKTVVTAAIAALAGGRVAVLKPAQTGVVDGEAGDIAEVRRLAGPVTGVELARYPQPLAPATAARLSGAAPVRPAAVAAAAEELAQDHDLVLVEGAGGLLVRYDEAGSTLADVAAALAAPVLVVTHAGLGTLNVAALTAEALSARAVPCLGAVIGSWPAQPDLASRCNVADLPDVMAAPLLGALPERAGVSDHSTFHGLVREALAPELGGVWCAAEFRRKWAPEW
jgi:dethiobiotin synthetase